jgi:hypothetical protein
MSYREYKILKSNACTKVGRPQKGFESWRNRIMEIEPIEFKEFLKGSFEKIEEIGGGVSLGYVENGVWNEYQKGQNWNTVKAVFPGKEPKFRSIESFLNEYKEYVEKFYKRQEAIALGF